LLTVRQQFSTLMTRRILAWSLFVLASLPFTAPFSTCDLATLIGHATGIALITPETPIVQGAPHNLSPMDNDAVLAVSLVGPTAGRAKALAIAQYSLQPTAAGDRPGGASLWLLNPMRLRDGRPVAPTMLRL
jgi:hypothetical protein